ncbi:GNAT family N-acetyltransferase [Qipengyuania sp. DSG2-2]|uniref:GNAT family N-acetyltransferase n=1 Tax=Qipengyuania sp. DGS2-2 TaxID=3349631 RepID=UPI0036D2C7A5
MQVSETGLDDPQVCALLEMHQRDMHAISPPGTSFALDLTGLAGPEITLFACREGGALAAVGALKQLSPHHAEIKSMRADPQYRGLGAGRAALEAIIERARTQGVRRLSLETGTSEDFAAAIALYRKYGFAQGDAFAGYTNGPHNQCYHLDL